MTNPLMVRDENGELMHSMVPKEDMAEILFEMCCHLDEFYRTLYEEQNG